MSSKKGSKTVQPASSMSRSTGRNCSAQDELGSHNAGLRWSRLRLSVYRRDKIDKMKKKKLEQEEDIQKLREHSERFETAKGELLEALRGNRFVSHVHFGNVQYGTGNVLVVDQAKDVIEELSKLMTETLSNIVELKHKAEKNEDLLKEYMDTVNAYISDMKSRDILDGSKLEKKIAELSASHSDDQLFVEGILALQEEENHDKMITGFDCMPKKSRRAVQRLVKKYGTQFNAKRFADFLGISSVLTLQNGIYGEDTDQHIALDVERCAAVVVEWTKNPDNTPEKFLSVVQQIDKDLVKEEEEKLVEEKRKTLETELNRKYHDDAVSNSPNGSTIQSIESQHSGRKDGFPVVTDRPAHIDNFSEWAAGLQSKIDEIQRSQYVTKVMTVQLKTMQCQFKEMQEKTMGILRSQNPFLK